MSQSLNSQPLFLFFYSLEANGFFIITRNWKVGFDIPEWARVGSRCQGIARLLLHVLKDKEDLSWAILRLECENSQHQTSTEKHGVYVFLCLLCEVNQSLASFSCAYFLTVGCLTTLTCTGKKTAFTISNSLPSSHLHRLLSPSAAWRPSRHRPPAPSWGARSPLSTRRTELSCGWGLPGCCCEPPGTERTHTCWGETRGTHYNTAGGEKRLRN